MPIYISAVIIYNSLRLLIMPFYILAQIVRERNLENGLYPAERKFSFSDIPKQMALSIGRIIIAPFYGIAMLFASIYSWIDPLNGIKLGSAIEHDWNVQVPMRNSGCGLQTVPPLRIGSGKGRGAS